MVGLMMMQKIYKMNCTLYSQNELDNWLLQTRITANLITYRQKQKTNIDAATIVATHEDEDNFDKISSRA